MPRRRTVIRNAAGRVVAESEQIASFTFMAVSAVDEETRMIAEAPDAATRYKLLAQRVRRHVENAHHEMVFAEVMDVTRPGNVNDANRLRHKLTVACREATEALTALDALERASKTA